MHEPILRKIELTTRKGGERERERKRVGSEGKEGRDRAERKRGLQGGRNGGREKKKGGFHLEESQKPRKSASA